MPPPLFYMVIRHKLLISSINRNDKQKFISFVMLSLFHCHPSRPPILVYTFYVAP